MVLEADGTAGSTITIAGKDDSSSAAAIIYATAEDAAKLSENRGDEQTADIGPEVRLMCTGKAEPGRGY